MLVPYRNDSCAKCGQRIGTGPVEYQDCGATSIGTLGVISQLATVPLVSMNPAVFAKERERRTIVKGLILPLAWFGFQAVIVFVSWVDSWPPPPSPPSHVQEIIDPDLHFQRVTAPHFFVFDHPPQALTAACKKYKDVENKFQRCVDDWIREHDYGVKYSGGH